MVSNSGSARKCRLSDILLIVMVIILAASLIGIFIFKGQSKKRDAQLKDHSANTAAVMYELLRHDVRDDLVKATKTEHYMEVADKFALYKKIPYCGYPSGMAQVIYSYMFQLEKDTYAFADSLRAGEVENQDAGRSRLIKGTEVIGTLCGLADEYVSGKLPKDSGIKNEKEMIKELKRTYDSQMTGGQSD
ncbi:MAG: hypothetical protein ACOX4U_04725 [Anaerovoracaceae bacterium]|jgi:type II secretory pathway pseudopilin PulG